MRNGKIKHIIVSLFLWLTISPLFLHTTRKWHQLNWPLRIILMLISPLFLQTYLLILFFVAVATADPYDWQVPEVYRAHMEECYSNPEVFEKSTGVSLPPFKVTKYEHGYVFWNGDFEDELTIEFDKPLSDEFYHYLDESGWVKCTDDPFEIQSIGIYIFGDEVIYKGRGGGDEHLHIYIYKDRSGATIEYGAS